MNKERQLTTNEFLMLVNLLGGERLIGVEDVEHITSMNQTQLEEVWQEVSAQLVSKHYINNETEDGLELDQELYKALQLYIGAHTCITLQLGEKEESVMEKRFFIAEEGVLSMEQEEEKLRLKAQETICNAAFYESIHLANVEEDEAKESFKPARVTLSKKLYYEFMSYMNMKNTEKAMALFVNNGMSEAVAKDAVNGFMNKNYFISIATQSVKQLDEMEIMMCYKGEQCYYQIAAIEDGMTIESLDEQTLKHSITSYINKSEKA